MSVDGRLYQWLHPATVTQAWMDGLNHNGYFVTVYTLTLCTKQYLQDHQVRQALTHLFRKVPTLRLCFKKREGRLWTCYMDREEIDFKVLKDAKADDMTEELAKTKFKISEGPCWCARLLTNEVDLKTPRTEIAEAFPHVRTLLLNNHHAIADGTTNTQTVDFFLQILDDVIAGKDIDDTKEFREYKGAEEMKELLDIQDAKLEKDQELYKVLLNEYSEGHLNKPVTCRVYPTIIDATFEYKFIQTVFDKEITKSFCSRCKKEGVTVNSGFVALLNVTLVDYMRMSGLVMEEYPIKSCSDTNMRRYLPKEMSDILGAHISLLYTTIMTPSCWQSSFWEYAKKVHTQIYKGLESDPISYLCIIRRLHFYDDTFRESYSGQLPPGSDQNLAPIGNLDIRIPTEGDHVRLGHLVRFASNASDPLMQMYWSFRGRLCYVLCYSTKLVPKEAAQKLMDLLVNNLKSQL